MLGIHGKTKDASEKRFETQAVTWVSADDSGEASPGTTAA
jgi:hypothetical protein